MAVDAALLDAAAAGGPPTLRFYRWDPAAVSLGRFQDPLRGIDWSAVRARGFGAVRRPTGGRAVLHHRELTYSLTLPPDVLAGAPLRDSCSVFRAGLLRALESCLGISLGEACPGPTIKAAEERRRFPANCFARVAESDIGAAGGKLVGSAQARTGGGMLQHGSILLGAERAAWEALFGDAGELAGLEELAVPLPPVEDLARQLAAGLVKEWEIELRQADVTATERENAERNLDRFDLAPILVNPCATPPLPST
jgi:lipoate-protein ligase A